MNSQYGEVFLFLTNLAWKCRMSLPVLVTVVFMVLDIRLQIEINIETGQVDADLDEVEEANEEGNDNDEDGGASIGSWETIDTDEESDSEREI